MPQKQGVQGKCPWEWTLSGPSLRSSLPTSYKETVLEDEPLKKLIFFVVLELGLFYIVLFFCFHTWLKLFLHLNQPKIHVNQPKIHLKELEAGNSFCGTKSWLRATAPQTQTCWTQPAQDRQKGKPNASLGISTAHCVLHLSGVGSTDSKKCEIKDACKVHKWKRLVSSLKHKHTTSLPLLPSHCYANSSTGTRMIPIKTSSFSCAGLLMEFKSRAQILSVFLCSNPAFWPYSI